MISQQNSSAAARAKVRGLVGLATLAVTGVAAPLASAAPGNAATSSTPAASPASGTATGTPPAAPRLSGADRIGTAIAVADAAYGQGKAKAQVAVLSRDDSFADALAGNALAAQKKGPLLLTGSGKLDPRVAAELKAILASGGTVYLLGGTSALSDQVRLDVAGLGFTPKRLAGSDRFETAVVIADEITPTPHTVLVATGVNFPDALSAGAAAASDPKGGVVLLSDDKVMPAATATYLAKTNPTAVAVYGVGGQAVAALDTQPGYANHFVPFAGRDRFDTATMIASNSTLFPAPTGVGIATGSFWADALSGGAYVGALHQPLLLADTASLSTGELGWLTAQGGRLKTLTVFGGTHAVPDSVVSGALTAAGPVIGTPPSASVTASGIAAVGQAVTFDASQSKAGTAAIASYTFDFGDKTAPVTVNAPATTATHAYAKKGKYTVTLTVTATDGTTATSTLAGLTVGAAVVTTGSTAVGGTGLTIQIADMDSHHNSGSKGTKPSPWCAGAVGPTDPSAATAPLIFYGQSDDGLLCGSGWDTPGIMIKNPTSATVTVDISVAVPAISQQLDALGNALVGGNGGGSWNLWQPVTLHPGQAVIFAQTNGNNFDPADTNKAGQIGAPAQWCTVPSKAIPTVKVTVNGTATTVKDALQVLNGHGVDPAGCLVQSSGSATRSDESFNWTAP